jgi:hypothetical protein
MEPMFTSALLSDVANLVVPWPTAAFCQQGTTSRELPAGNYQQGTTSRKSKLTNV